MKPWGDWEMVTAAISCTKCSQVAGLIHAVGRNIPGRCGQVAGLIQKVSRSSSEASSLRAAAFRSKSYLSHVIDA